MVTEGSHVNPTFELVKQLIKKQVKVTYLLFNQECKEAITLRAIGAHVISSPEALLTTNHHLSDEQKNVLIHPFSNYVDQPEGYASAEILSHYFMAMLWDDLLALTKKLNPDVIVYDVVLNGWGKYIGRALNIPAFASFAPAFSYGPYWKDPQFQDYLAQYYQKALPPTEKRIWAVDYLHKKLGSIGQDITVNIPVAFSDSAYATFVYSYPKFIDYHGESFLGTHLLFTGYVSDNTNTLTKEEEQIINTIKQRNQNKKLIFVSMGTVSSKPEEFFAMIADALGNGSKHASSNDNIIVALHPGYKNINTDELYDAKQIDGFIKGLGHTNFIVYDYFPLNHLLEDIDIFIGHGGYNSSMQALQHYIPIILLPIHGDQLWVGETFKSFGIAKTIPLTINPMPFKDNFVEWEHFAASNKRTQFVQWIQTAVKNILNNPEQQKESTTKKQYIDSLLQTNDGYEKAAELIMQS